MTNSIPFSKPLEDSVPKVDNAIAVGEDLAFQRRWWRFERALWVFFAFLIFCDLIGLFGRGYMANAERHAKDQSVYMTYERIERSGTPSTMTFHFGPEALRNGQVRLFVSQSVVKSLGAQRISPEPASSVIGNGGVTYTFPATDESGIVEISLKPTFSGVHHFSVGVPGSEYLNASVLVFP